MSAPPTFAVPLSEYELLRAANVARNNAVLKSLGIDTTSAAGKKKLRPAPKKRRRIKELPTAPPRRSRRAKSLPAPTYTPENAAEERQDNDAQRQELISKGWRGANGRWRGERFGAVPGVEVGSVF